jgi:hypothetical protein
MGVKGEKRTQNSETNKEGKGAFLRLRRKSEDNINTKIHRL